MADTTEMQQVPWYESNLLWVPISLGAGILLAVVAAMKHDLRWLLSLAALCFIFASWVLAKRWLRNWALGLAVLASSLLICVALLWMHVWLGRPEVLSVANKDRTSSASDSKLSSNDTAVTQQGPVTPPQKPLPTPKKHHAKKAPKLAATIPPPSTQVAIPTASTSGNESPAIGAISQGPGSAFSFDQKGGITAAQVNIGNVGRVVDGIKRNELLTKLQKSGKVVVALVAFEPVTKEMDNLVAQLQAIFRDAEWGEIPASKADIRNVHIQNAYGPGHISINESEGMHCVGSGDIFSNLVTWLSAAGLNCKISDPNLYPLPDPVPTITIYIGRDLG